MRSTYDRVNAFTLIEISIVLVVIGLLVGGVLVGRDLISAATVRAQISQIEQFDFAANTFRAKYLYLPGDMPESDALKFGFAARAAYSDGNGDGAIDTGYAWGGEASLFWNDLSVARLIPGSHLYITGGHNTPGYNLTAQTGSAIANYIPPARLSGLYVYVYNGGITPLWWSVGKSDSYNYYGIAGVDQVAGYGCCGARYTTLRMRVADAYSIDTKIDDGLPQTGAVLAAYLKSPGGQWAGEGCCYGNYQNPVTYPVPYASTNCYDNGNIAGPQKCSVGLNANRSNCALTFKFK